MKVYVVTHMDYEGDVTVEGVFRSYDLALQYVTQECRHFTDPLKYARLHYEIVTRDLA